MHHTLPAERYPQGLSALRLAFAMVAIWTGRAAVADEAAQREAFFEESVRPVLVEHCFACHGPDTDPAEANLRLDSRAGLLQGGRSGPAIVPGDPEASLLVAAIRQDTTLQMPPKEKLSLDEISAIERWVLDGAAWTSTNAADGVPTAETSGTAPLTEEERSFWAFQPLADVVPPEVAHANWGGSPLDQFILADLTAQGLSPAPPADKHTLLRRVTFDLHGLPPTPEETAAFLADESPEAYAQVVERLLASPRYGERWGRHWLDAVRYADSNGMDDNVAYPDAWRYRDWVIAAFNDDLPYGEFLQRQFAGDLLPAASPEEAQANLIATGLLMIGPKMLAEDDPVKQQMDIIDDQIETLGRAVLGLTLGCARCHDHKYDPIRQHDYYALAGIFYSTRTMLSYRVDSKWNSRALGDPPLEADLEQLERQIDELDRRLVLDNFVGRDSEKQQLAEQLAQLKEHYAQIPKAMAAEEASAQDLQIFLRGNHLTRGALAPRGFPQVLATAPEPIAMQGSGRLELARWLVRPEHPLTWRVIANRVWQGHFGQGLVRSTDNFGRLGERPDHPALLDWLASQLVVSGGSLKELHRTILLSSTYQMSGAFGARAAQIDPENRLLSRFPRRRLEAEALRDSLLSVAGRLNLTTGGPPLPEQVFAILSPQQIAAGGLYDAPRRSVYLPVVRSGLYDVFSVFDFPDPAVPGGQRSATVVAPQALFMLNSPLVGQAARGLAERILREAPPDDDQRLALAFAIVFARSPTPAERTIWLEFAREQRELRSAPPTDAADDEVELWESFARALLASNEFSYID